MVTEEKKRQEKVSAHPYPQVLLGYPRVILLFCHVTLCCLWASVLWCSGSLSTGLFLKSNDDQLHQLIQVPRLTWRIIPVTLLVTWYDHIAKQKFDVVDKMREWFNKPKQQFGQFARLLKYLSKKRYPDVSLFSHILQLFWRWDHHSFSKLLKRCNLFSISLICSRVSSQMDTPKISDPRRRPGVIVVRCPNHFKWFLVMWRSIGSIFSCTTEVVALSQRENPWRKQVATGHGLRWG